MINPERQKKRLIAKLRREARKATGEIFNLTFDQDKRTEYFIKIETLLAKQIEEVNKL